MAIKQRAIRHDPAAPLDVDEHGRPLHMTKGVRLIRDNICYPALVAKYGATAIKGARCFFENPRNIEETVHAILHGEPATPLCDEWRAQKLGFEPQEYEL